MKVNNKLIARYSAGENAQTNNGVKGWRRVEKVSKGGEGFKQSNVSNVMT